jgi:bifunctional non-homologous end joining protein LigD
VRSKLATLKWRANRRQEFVVGGYIPNGDVLDSILVGYYEGRDLMYAASVRAGFSPEFRRVLLPHFEELRVARGARSPICRTAAKGAGVTV